MESRSSRRSRVDSPDIQGDPVEQGLAAGLDAQVLHGQDLQKAAQSLCDSLFCW